MFFAKHLSCTLLFVMLALSRSFRFIPAAARFNNSNRFLSMAMEVKVMDMVQFAEILKSDQRNNYSIVDVREPGELAVAEIKGKALINIPLGDPNNWTEEAIEKVLQADKPVICMCHHGMRSMRAAQLLITKGYTVYNLTGGIHSYSTQIDATVPTY